MMKLRIALLYVIFAFYIYALFKIVLFKGYSIDLMYLGEQLRISVQDPFRIADRIGHGNLVPLHEIKRALEAGTNHGFLNVYGNIAIFAPFGLLHGLLGIRSGGTLAATAKNAFILSLFLELLQATFAIGAFDVDDMLLNTCGGVIGYLVYRLYVQCRGWLRGRGTDKEKPRAARIGTI
ncbi:VanZ family protein [Paenibacillus agaridevorans]|uniref:VanZ family protein n=1 Tax=Paenibacillus agaridevorans TaxID=171404 RepID=UPI001BE41DF9|nr:VanZ family protein [Paenibacillus agaridevorans]